MKIDELIQGLLEIKSQHGNLEVGIYNKEFGCFYSCENVFKKVASSGGNPMLDDDEDLGNEFVAID